MKRTLQSSKKANFRNNWLPEMADYKRRIMLQRGVVFRPKRNTSA